MRFWISGPRMFGGLIRPGVSFGLGDFRSRVRSAVIAQDYVYVIHGEHGLTKVGFSTSPDQRLASLRTASPSKLWFAFVAPCGGNAYRIEQEAHAILAKSRVAGEWFAVSPDLAIAAIFGAADRIGYSMSNQEPAPKQSYWPKSSIGQILMVFLILYIIGSFMNYFK
jgi:hypothetical protein